MKSRTFHDGYYLSAITTLEPEGRWRARVAVMALDGERTRSQRFLDFGLFDNEEAANTHAIAEGKAWIEAQRKLESLRVKPSF